MKRIGIVVLVAIVSQFIACTSTQQENLIGEWKLDSAYYYYNNFEYRKDGWHQEEIYGFSSDGYVKTKAQNGMVVNNYAVKDGKLLYFDHSGKLINEYEIVVLNKHNLELKAVKNPLFKGPNQERFEVRYFSKVQLDSL